jgi:putative ABC transport system permease protein
MFALSYNHNNMSLPLPATRNRAANLFECFWQDLRGVGRSLRLSPAYGAGAILTCALGIGANTAVFSVVYATLLKPLPYFQPDQIFSVELVLPHRLDQMSTLPMRIQDYLAWRTDQTVFSSVAALRPCDWSLTGGVPERIGGACISSNFFGFLGVLPEIGRGFVETEEVVGADKVVVISDALWRRRFGANPNVIGSTLKLNGEDVVIVGIAPPSLLVPTGTQLHGALGFASHIDIWRPIAPDKRELEGEDWNTGILVRLEQGASAERARQQLDSMLNASLRAQVPDAKISLRTRLVPIREVYSGKFRARLLLVFAASAMLMLIALTTLANLLLARAAARRGEFAVRIAIGASRGRLLAQVVTETTALAFLGGLGGIVCAFATAGLLSRYDPTAERLVKSSHLNFPVLLFAIGLALLTGFICGAVPVWLASRTNASAMLRNSAGRISSHRAVRLQFAVVGAEIALGTTLMATAGLLLHSFVRQANVNRGYDVERTLALDLELPEWAYSNQAQWVAFYGELTDRLWRLQGVVAAGAISDLPATGVSATRTIFYSSDTDFQNTVMWRPAAGIRSATPGYFKASRLMLMAGRFFTDLDRSPVAVVSASLAQRLWPNEPLDSALGRVIREGDVTAEPLTIIGVVEDVRLASAERELPPQLYRSYRQRASPRMTVIVRTSVPPSLLAPAVRDEVRHLAPSLPITAIRPMREIVSASIAKRSYEALLTFVFGVIAVLLGVTSVYGVVSYSVALWTCDIGLRMALGANRTDVVFWVLRRGLKSVAIGMFVGLSGAVIIARYLRSLLFTVAPIDPWSLAASILILGFTSIVACYVPARRAAALNPLDAIQRS